MSWLTFSLPYNTVLWAFWFLTECSWRASPWQDWLGLPLISLVRQGTGGQAAAVDWLPAGVGARVRIQFGAHVNVEVGVDQIFPEPIIVLQCRDLGGGVGGVVIAEDSLQSVWVVVSGGLLLVQEVVWFVTQIVFRAELIITVLLVLLAHIVNIMHTMMTVYTVYTVHAVEAVGGHVHLDPWHKPLTSRKRLSLKLWRPELVPNDHCLLCGVLCGPRGAWVAHCVAALHAVPPLHLAVTPAPQERLPRPLPPLGVGLQGGHAQHLLAGVVQMVVMEVGEVRLSIGPGPVPPGGAGVRLAVLRDVGGVAGGPPVHMRGLHVVVSEVPQPRHGVAHGAHGAERVRVIRANSDRAAGERHRRARALAADGWKGG